jgi:hypothetical protein
MERREQLDELHLALEGAVDQMARAQRLVVAAQGDLDGLTERLERAFAEVVALRNEVRERLMRELAAQPKGPRKLPIL